MAYATTYGSTDEPRVFKVEMAEKHFSVMKGDFYYIEGKASYQVYLLFFFMLYLTSLCLTTWNSVVLRVRWQALWLWQHGR